jgi:hypothetical protein
VVDDVLGQLPLASLLPREREVSVRARNPKAISLPLVPH